MLPLDLDTSRRVAADAPNWVAELHDRGFKLFEELSMPDSTEEVWRYVDLDFDLAELGVPHGPGRPLSEDGEIVTELGDLAGRAIVVDGHTVESQHDAGEGVVFGALAKAIVEHEQQARKAFGRGIPADLDKFSAAHHAFQQDGIFLSVPAGRSVERPFYVEIQAVTPEALTLPRVTAVLEEDAEASLVIQYRSSDDEPFIVVPQVEVVVGDASRLRLSAVQAWGNRTRAVAQQRMTAGGDATLRFAEAGLGGILSRLHLTVDLAGRGTSAEVLGLYFGDGDQILDYRAFINHIGPNTTSDMFLKGAVADQARSVFSGLIRIEPEGQKTNAFQTNRNLVLSDGAEAHSVPNLEILANDVRCGHGSTVGPIDEDQRYYLMSRGLDRVRADRLQVKGFFEQVLRRLPEAGLAGPLREAVVAKYVAAQEEGRV
ncbi:MAG: Fe-S cluster assembly protein SufD [Acidimicrobiia bacterium]